MPKTLQSLMPHNPVTIAKLHGLKSIIRVESNRSVSWYLATPPRGDGDVICTLLERTAKGKFTLPRPKMAEDALLAEYADRIISVATEEAPDPQQPAKAENAKPTKSAALISILREMAEFYEYDEGRTFHASPGDIAEFSRGSMSAQAAASIAKAHPELFTYRRAHRKTCQGCLASRAAAGYYPARIGWTVTKSEQGN